LLVDDYGFLAFLTRLSYSDAPAGPVSGLSEGAHRKVTDCLALSSSPCACAIPG